MPPSPFGIQAERWTEEFEYMLPLPAPFEPRKKLSVTASRQTLVLLAGAKYSVPSPWKGLQIWAYIGPNEVELVNGSERVTHERKARGEKSIKYRHYLSELVIM
jgi:hypothetical protein